MKNITKPTVTEHTVIDIWGNKVIEFEIEEQNQNLSIEDIIAKETKLGNDIEIRKSKNGIKVFLVSKKLIAEFDMSH